jgi:hypothetical protein
MQSLPVENSIGRSQPSHRLQILIASELAVATGVAIVGVFESFHSHSLLRGICILLCGLMAVVAINILKERQFRREIPANTPLSAIPASLIHSVVATFLVWNTVIVAFLAAVVGTALRARGVL